MVNLQTISPDDGKYGDASKDLLPYLSAEAEWRAFAHIQKALLETRVRLGQAESRHLKELEDAFPQFDPLQADAFERDPNIQHDQLAVLEELGRHISSETKALLHPGTTSYDIMDTARSCLLKRAWYNVVRERVSQVVEKLCDLSGEHKDILQAGRTHLQRTSPVPLGLTFSLYAARLADRIEKCDATFDDLRGKVSGIVGTGASIDMVIGQGKSIMFEQEVLKRLGLQPDLTATQVVQKERLADVGHGLVTLMHVLGDFANDMRLLYSSEIGEVTSRDDAKRLGGSSADASKNNPTNWENIAGKVAVVESGMRVLYAMIQSDLQRDLRSSVQGRYQPHGMIAEVYESFCRASKSLGKLSINRDKVAEHLQAVREFPSEAMVAILRGEGYVHPVHGVGHDFVKVVARKAKEHRIPLLQAALEDEHFRTLYDRLSEDKINILQGDLEFYIGSSAERMDKNLKYARIVARRSFP